MLKGGEATIGDTASFAIAQDHTPVEHDYEMNAILLEQLQAHGLEDDFEALTPSRRKDILKYLGSVKTEETAGRMWIK